jgi:hypothetical protein
VGRAEDDFVTGIDEQREHEKHRRGRTARDEHPLGVDRHPRPLSLVASDGLAELG